MNVSSLLLGPDRHTCHLELNSLSDQECMELLFDALDSASSEDFKDPTDEYKDVCKWRGVKCNGRRRVVYIRVSEKGEISPIGGKWTFLKIFPKNFQKIFGG